MIRFPSLENSGPQQAIPPNKKMQESIQAAIQSIERMGNAKTTISTDTPSHKKSSSFVHSSFIKNKSTTIPPQKHRESFSRRKKTPTLIAATRHGGGRSTMTSTSDNAMNIYNTPQKLLSASSSNPLERRAARQRIGLGKRTSNSALVGNDAYDACASHSVGIQLALAQVMRKHSTMIAIPDRIKGETANHNNQTSPTRHEINTLSEQHRPSIVGNEAVTIGQMDPDLLASTQQLVVCLTQLRNAVLPLPSSDALLQALAVVEQLLFSNWYRPATDEDEKLEKEMQKFVGRHASTTSSSASTAAAQQSTKFGTSLTQLTNAQVVLKLEQRIRDNESDVSVEEAKVEAVRQDQMATVKQLEESQAQVQALDRQIRQMKKEKNQLDERLERLRNNAVDSVDEYKALETNLHEMKDEAKQIIAAHEQLVIESLSSKEVKKGLQKHVQEKCDEIKKLREQLKQVDGLKQALSENTVLQERCRSAIMRPPLVRAASETDLYRERQQYALLMQQQQQRTAATAVNAKTCQLSEQQSFTEDDSIVKTASSGIGSALFSTAPTRAKAHRPSLLSRGKSVSDFSMGSGGFMKRGVSFMLPHGRVWRSIKDTLRPRGGKLPVHKEVALDRLVDATDSCGCLGTSARQISTATSEGRLRGTVISTSSSRKVE